MERVTANTFFCWTDKAEKENPQRSKAGDPIWPHYKHSAPAKWLEDGLIIDASEFKREGQVDLFECL